MTRTRFTRVITTTFFAALFAGCLNGGSDIPDETDPGGTGTGGDGAACGAPLVENRAVYEQDSLGVLEVQLQVDDLAALADVDANVEGAEVPAIFREGDFGAGVSAPNATLKLRGKSTRYALQKSYKVKLASEAGLWRGQRELNLNKHPYDLTRVRQQLSMALFRSVPHFSSLRTQFVHLVINGKSKGLYTHVEEPDKRFLAAHGLDPEGTLYKAQLFSFLPIDDATLADETKLDLILEKKANGDPEKLRRMLAAVNDPERDLDEVLDTYFDRDNYVTWLALNLLLGNFDTRTQNFILYSPSGCDTWYFLPWDYDGSLLWHEQPANPPRPRWMAGLANFWGMAPHERFMRDKDNLAELRAKMKSLRETALSDQKIAGLLAQYRPIVREWIAKDPDLWNIPLDHSGGHVTEPALRVAQWDTEYDRIHGSVGKLAAEFDAVFPRPMPMWQFHMPMPGSVFFGWSPSYTLPGDEVTYDFQLATSAEFQDGTIVHEKLGMKAITLTLMPEPPPGTYYWRVLARSTNDPTINWQNSFDIKVQLVMP